MMFALLKQNLEGEALRGLYELVGDTDALTRLDQAAMGQTGGVQLTEMGVARGWHHRQGPSHR